MNLKTELVYDAIGFEGQFGHPHLGEYIVNEIVELINDAFTRQIFELLSVNEYEVYCLGETIDKNTRK